MFQVTFLSLEHRGAVGAIDAHHQVGQTVRGVHHAPTQQRIHVVDILLRQGLIKEYLSYIKNTTNQTSNRTYADRHH